MSAADLLEDGFPHGTPTGYDQGCRGAGCPTGMEFGLSCRVAWERSKGDYAFRKLLETGATIAELADAIAATSKPGPIREWAKRVGIHVEPRGLIPIDVIKKYKRAHGIDAAQRDPNPVIPLHPKKGKKMSTATNATDVSMVVQEPQDGELTAETDSPSSENDRSWQVMPDPSAVKAWEVRRWARENGMIVSSLGRLPLSVIGAYLAAHTDAAQPLAESTQDSEPLGMPGEEPETEEEAWAEGTSTVEDEAMGHPTVEDLTAQLAAAHVALEFVLRAWAGEKARRVAQERLVFTLAAEVTAAKRERDADAELIQSMDLALIAASVEISQLSDHVSKLQKRPWYLRWSA